MSETGTSQRSRKPTRRPVFGLPIEVGSRNVITRRIERFILQGVGGYTIAGNVEKSLAVRSSDTFANIVDRATMVIADGFPVATWATLRWQRTTHRIDLPLTVLKIAAVHSRRVFLLGTKPGVVEKAAHNVTTNIGAFVVGSHHGYFGDVTEIIPILRDSHADIVLVGLGSPRQEHVVALLAARFPQTLFVPCGGAIDILGGLKRRAPYFVQKLGLEWLYRMVQEPKRVLRVCRAIFRS